MGITKLVQDFLDFAHALPPVLAFIPGGLSTDALESRNHAPISTDDADFNFMLGNLSIDFIFSDLEIFLIFDFTGTNVGVSLDKEGPFVEKSLFGQDPLKLRLDDVRLAPTQRTDPQRVFLRSNLDGKPAAHGNYQIGLAGTFKSEPFFVLPDVGLPPLTGGLIPFSVVED